MAVPNAPTKEPRLDPQMRSVFREMARDIIARDRHSRRHGLSQNTIGAIEHALVKAYALGRGSQAGRTPTRRSHSGTVVDWISIPPRSRDTLVSMTASFSGRLVTPDYKPYEIERFSEDSRIRWAIVSHGVREHRSIADGSAAPLVRMGLIAAVDASGGRYALTTLGMATCRDYWHRSDADDPTLPRMSMR